MRRAPAILASLACLAALAGPATIRASTRAPRVRAATATPGSSKPETIDGIAVRIESDIITDSEVAELAAYQKLVDGKSESRAEVIRELIDQWIVRGEAQATQYPQPSAADVDRAYAELQKEFGTTAEFKDRCAEAGINEVAVRRILTQQIYLSRFLDFRFRPAAQVDSQQIRKYYQTQLVPKLKAKGQKIPPLADVEPEIHEVLIQRDIDALSKQWLADTRSGLTIDILPRGAA
ncbi:MAG: hypothetical protein ACRD4R_03320 [Candidatus Acidiferrales bacterium]